MDARSAKFLELAFYYEQLEEKLNQTRAELESVMADLGIGSVFQDPNDLVVYKITKPKGKYVYFKDIDYVRTTKEGEKIGSLAKKEAESLGYTLKK